MEADCIRWEDRSSICANGGKRSPSGQDRSSAAGASFRPDIRGEPPLMLLSRGNGWRFVANCRRIKPAELARSAWLPNIPYSRAVVAILRTPSYSTSLFAVAKLLTPQNPVGGATGVVYTCFSADGMARTFVQLWPLAQPGDKDLLMDGFLKPQSQTSLGFWLLMGFVPSMARAVIPDKAKTPVQNANRVFHWARVGVSPRIAL